MNEPAEHRPTEFAGTASYYASYRVPYPAALIEDLRVRAALSGRGTLLDLAAGTGEVAYALQPHFREVWAVDQEPDMVAVGRQKARELGTSTVNWSVGRAEDVAFAPESFELVTIGSAFHRLEYRLVSRRATDWLAAGGHLAVLNSNSIWSSTAEWKALVVDTVRKWCKDRSPTEKSAPKSVSYAEVLETAGYSNVSRYDFEEFHVWSVDSLLGYLYSTSVASKMVLGDLSQRFEDDLRRMLLAYDPSGQYRETIHFDYVIGRRS